MPERYVATFDSLRPLRGVVVDEEGGRYAGFPSVARAERAAATMNQLPLVDDAPSLANNLTWRSIETGERIDPESVDLGPTVGD